MLCFVAVARWYHPVLPRARAVVAAGPFFLVHAGGAGALRGVDGLDVLALVQGALVAAQAALGELVDALVGRRAARLDHVEDAALVRGQTDHFARDAAAQLDARAQSLWEVVVVVDCNKTTAAFLFGGEN